jgi:transposase
LALGKIAFCEVLAGQVVHRGTVRELDGLEGLLGAETGKARVAVEASRSSWLVCDWLAARGHEAVMVDTTRLAQVGIGAHGRKTDRIDAEALARSIAKDTAPRAHILSPARRLLRERLNQRGLLVAQRACLITATRGVARGRGIRLPTADTEDFVRTLKKRPPSPELAEEIAPTVAIVESLDAQIVVLDAKLVELCKDDRSVQLCATAPSVGLIVAGTFVSVIDEPARFKDAHQVEAYLGLVPNEDSSGTRRRLGAITKKGNSYARSMLVQAAWQIQRSTSTDDPLVLWAKQVARRRGKRIAAVATARRLAGILWAMWRKDRTYDPAKLAAQSADGKRVESDWTAHDAARLDAAARKLAGRAVKRVEPLTPACIERKSRTSKPRRRTKAA